MRHSLRPRLAVTWFRAPDKEDDEYVSGDGDDTSFALDDLSGFKISHEIADRGHEYYMENRVRYISIDGNMGSDSFINNAMKFDYDDLTWDAEFVEIVYNNGLEYIVLKRLDNQNSLDFLKDFSEIEYSCDSIIALFFVSPSTLSKGLQFRIKKSGASNEYRYFSVACGPDVCDADEYYDLIEKYCLDENIDYYRSIEQYRK